MIKQLLKQIWAQRKVNIWLWLELVIVSVCLWFVTDYLFVVSSLYYSPTGFDISHVYKVELDEIGQESSVFVLDSLRKEHAAQILDRLRAYNGVEHVSVSSEGMPYKSSWSNGGFCIDTSWVHGNKFVISSPDYFRVFRIADKNGSINALCEAARLPNTLIISKETEEKYKKQGNIEAFGHPIRSWNVAAPDLTVRAISQDIRLDEFNPDYPLYIQIAEDEVTMLSYSPLRSEICVRVSEDADTPDFLPDFRKAMKEQLRLGNFFLMNIVSMSDVRDNYFTSRGQINDAKTRVAVLFFLLVNILMGVIGTFWIRTQHRKSELGLRLALGSSKKGLRAILIEEGILILLLALLPSIIISMNIANTELLDNRIPVTVTRYLIGIGISFGLMALMIVLGILIPARQAMQVQPAEVLKEE